MADDSEMEEAVETFLNIVPALVDSYKQLDQKLFHNCLTLAFIPSVEVFGIALKKATKP